MNNAKHVNSKYSNEELQRLEESEIRFRALLTATSDVIYRMSPDWSIMQTLDGKGFLHDAGDPLNNWMEKYTCPEDIDIIQSAIDKAIRTKTIFELEHRVLRADGSLGWTFSRAVPLLDEQGDITEWFGAASDITEKKRTEAVLETTRKELERSKALYEAITSSTPDLIYVFDLNYRFVYANKALLTMWGTTEEEAAGKGLLELGYEPWHAAMHEREIDTVIATKQTIRGEVSFPHATLGRRIYDYIFAPVLDDEGKVIAISGTTRDISDLKAAEDALIQSEEQFRSLTQSLPQLIWTAGPDGYCDFFNQRWYDYTGSTAEESQGNKWIQFVHPQYREALFAKWQQSIASGVPVVFEFQLKAKNNDYKWFYVVGNPIKDEQNNIRKWVGALTNIEEQKAVEEKLEQLINERTLALQRSNTDLLQFAHVASHDLKEPLRKVQIFAGCLKDELANDLPGKSAEYLTKIDGAINRMRYMIDGVLQYSAISNLESTFGEVNIETVISNIETDLEILIEQKQAVIQHRNLPVLTGSPVLLYQLFYTLINNSLKFSVPAKPPVISVFASNTEQDGKSFAKIVVQDNGIGFDNSEVEFIFGTFTRLHSKDKYEGTGLGLAFCKKIVERHHGTITAIGKEGAGAEFIVLLPQPIQ